MLNPVHLPPTISLGLFSQNGGWVFVAVPYGKSFHTEKVLFSGKRKTLELAIEAAKEFAPNGSSMVYSMLDKSLE